MEKMKVGVVGATGMVGQRFLTLLDNHPYFEVTAELVGINQYLLYASFSMLVAEDRWQNFGTECFMTEEQLKALIEDIESEIRTFPEKL